jgi:hypothetical protein
MSKKNVVVGIVDSRAQAAEVVAALKNARFDNDDISVLFPDAGDTNGFVYEHHTKAPEGAITGVAGGSVLGGTFGLLVGAGLLAIPGLGAFIAAGPLIAAITGAAAGAAVGGLAGGLIGLGMPEIEAKKLENKVREGNILLAVHYETRIEQQSAEDLLKKGGAHHIAISGSELSIGSEIAAARGIP